MKVYPEGRLELESFSEAVTATRAAETYMYDPSHPTLKNLHAIFKYASNPDYMPEEHAFYGEEAHLILAALRDHLTHPDSDVWHQRQARLMLGLTVASEKLPDIPRRIPATYVQSFNTEEISLPVAA